MSQVAVFSAGGSMPDVPTSFTTDDGVAVPVANNLNLLTDDTSDDNDNGIQDTGVGATVTIYVPIVVSVSSQEPSQRQMTH